MLGVSNNSNNNVSNNNASAMSLFSNSRVLLIVFLTSMIVTAIISSLRMTVRYSNTGTATPSAKGGEKAFRSTSTSPGSDTPLLHRMFVESFNYLKPKQTEEKHKLICLLKTHKTASTTLGSILYRFASLNHLTVYNEEGHQLKRWWKKAQEEQKEEMASNKTNKAEEENGMRFGSVSGRRYDMVSSHL